MDPVDVVLPGHGGDEVGRVGGHSLGNVVGLRRIRGHTGLLGSPCLQQKLPVPLGAAIIFGTLRPARSQPARSQRVPLRPPEAGPVRPVGVTTPSSA
jgi:hypothetical protein